MASVGEIIRRRHRRQARRQANETRRRALTIVLSFAFLVLVVLPGGAAVGGAGAIYLQAIQNLPTPNQPSPTGADPTAFYDSSGTNLVYKLQNPLSAEGSWVALDTLPPYVISATLAAEDPGFLTHAGFNPLQTLTDLWRNALIGTLPPDPSITGRLVRNVIAPLDDLEGARMTHAPTRSP